MREGLAALAAIPQERTEKTLIARLAELEDALLGATQLPHDPHELRGLLDTVCAGLSRMPSAETRRAVVAHGLKRQAQLGDTLGRLSALSDLNLADDPATTHKLVAALRAELPVKVLGVTVKSARKARGVECLIAAVSGTDAPEVRQALADIVSQYPSQSFTAQAQRALERCGPTVSTGREDKAGHPSIAGDLAVFGLPSLLQSLADSRLSGTLTLHSPHGHPTATVWLRDGLLAGARAGRLSGLVAVYDLLQTPSPGRFAFVHGTPDSPPEDQPREVVRTLLEGMRRYDELTRACALVADAARFMPGAKRPTPPPDETDGALYHRVWTDAAAGVTPAECENSLPVDRYRVRRLFERWVTEGALVPRTDGA